jgi:hypothetical protein
MLRGLAPGQTVDLAELQSRLLMTSDAADAHWLNSIIKALERDGLVEWNEGANCIRLRT